MPTVLIAEDDEFSRDMLMRRLHRQGFEVVTAADGREALLVARQHRPDIIVMDLDMPVMDGRSAIRSLHNDPHLFRIPIIVLTAHASRESVAEAAELGCMGFESKPVVLRRLLEKIQEILAARSAPAAARDAE